MSDLLTKMFLGGFVWMHILYHAIKEPIFGVEMREELARHGDEVGAGTLYPMLHQLEEVGYLTSHAEVVGGKPWIDCRATAAGAAALDATKVKLRELGSEVLHDRPPKPSIRLDQ